MPVGVSRTTRPPPVSIAEFRTALLKIWHPFSGSQHGRRGGSFPGNLPYRIALCVSGGPDSMALAYLFSELNRARRDSDFEIPRLELNAFIVDHKARENSRNEAAEVSQWLSDLGISSEILSVPWPDGTVPSQLPNFETQARQHRLYLFRKACLSSRLSSLFLGHHRDDHAETILIRLLRYHHVGTLGLQGIPAVKPFPWHARRTGLSDSVSDLTVPIRSLISPSHVDDCPGFPGSTAKHAINDLGGQIHISQDTVTIFRPLLDFPKTRLISTCQSSGTPYSIDPTNFNPSLTFRNACRHLFRHQLPKAIQPASLVTLGDKASAFEAALLQRSDELLSETRILSFDIRSGTVAIRFPNPALPVWSSIDLRTASFYLRRVLSLVVPLYHRNIVITSLFHIVESLFPHLCPIPHAPETGRQASSHYPRPLPAGVTVAGVLFTPSHLTHKVCGPRDHSTSVENASQTVIHPPTYTLSRQPPAQVMLHSLSQPLPFLLQPDGTLCQTPLQSTFPLNTSQSATFSYDRRFLFCLHNPSRSSVLVSPPHSSMPSSPSSKTTVARGPTTKPTLSTATTATTADRYFVLRPLADYPPSGLPKSWHAVLRNSAPGKIRYSLPAVFCIGGDEAEQVKVEKGEVVEKVEGKLPINWKQVEQKNFKRSQETEAVVALPTLGLWRDFGGFVRHRLEDTGDGEQNSTCTRSTGEPWWAWDISYSQVDAEVLRRVKWGPAYPRVNGVILNLS